MSSKEPAMRGRTKSQDKTEVPKTRLKGGAPLPADDKAKRPLSSRGAPGSKAVNGAKPGSKVPASPKTTASPKNAVGRAKPGFERKDSFNRNGTTGTAGTRQKRISQDGKQTSNPSSARVKPGAKDKENVDVSDLQAQLEAMQNEKKAMEASMAAQHEELKQKLTTMETALDTIKDSHPEAHGALMKAMTPTQKWHVNKMTLSAAAALNKAPIAGEAWISDDIRLTEAEANEAAALLQDMIMSKQLQEEIEIEMNKAKDA